MTTPTTFKELVNLFLGLINLAIPLIIAGVFLIFAWKLIDAWVINVADEKKREEGKQLLVTAVLVLVLLISAWGIVFMLRNSIFGS